MNITNFPTEVLEVIFFHLPLKDRKNASMVCRSWAQLAFSRPCMLSTELTIESSNVGDLSSLENSQRPYRNICFRYDCGHFGQSQLNIVRSLLQRLCLTIQRMRFIWDTLDEPFDLKLLLKLLEVVPTIKELIVEDHANQYDEQKPDPTVELQTFGHLEKLTASNCLMDNVHFDLVKFAPHVKIVNLTSSGRNLWSALQMIGSQIRSMCIKTETKGNFKDLWSVEPHSLEKLHLHRLCSDLMEPRDFQLHNAIIFFSQCRALTALGLELQVPIAVIQMIAQTCPMLRSLLVYEIEEGWRMIHILKQFEQLSSVTVKVAHFEVKPNTEKLKLKTLKHLTLDGVEFENPFDFFCHLSEIAPGLRELQFTQYDDSCNESYHLTVLKAIMQVKLPLLSKLVLVDNSSYFPSHVFNQFNLLSNLKELRLAYYGLSAWNRSITVPGIEKLSLDIYQLTNFQLRNLLKIFPSLVKLDVVEPEDPLDLCIDDLPRTSLLCDFNIRKRGFNILDEWKIT